MISPAIPQRRPSRRLLVGTRQKPTLPLATRTRHAPCFRTLRETSLPSKKRPGFIAPASSKMHRPDTWFPEPTMNRSDAYDLVTEYTLNPNLVKHMLAVEAAMRAYARKLGQDEETWGIVGLLHDFDYELWPAPPDHRLKGAEILRQRGYPDDVIYAIKSHADYLPDCPRVNLVDKALYACDELCGLITAAALVRPSV